MRALTTPRRRACRPLLRRLLRLGGAALIGLALAPALANDSAAELAIGGLVLTRSADVVMEREDLFISRDKVRVDYVFRNTGERDVETQVAFPLPEIPAADETGYVEELSLDWERPDNPVHFKLWVDGKPAPFETQAERRPGGVELTFHWLQRFPKGQAVAIRHEYEPVVGGFVGFCLSPETVAAYCIEPDLLRWARRHVDKDAPLVPQCGAYVGTVGSSWVHYILTTATSWKGPIGHFRLRVRKDDPRELVSFCGEGVRKLDARTFVMEKTDYVPQQDLRVLYLIPHE